MSYLNRRKKSFRIVAVIALLSLSACILSACLPFPDMGDIEDEAEYQEMFPSITLIGGDAQNVGVLDTSLTTITDVGIGDLYNDSAVNDFNQSDFECPTEVMTYRYMAIEVEYDTVIEDVYLYFKAADGSAVTSLSISLYVVDAVPSKFILGGDDDFDITTDDDGNETGRTLKTDFDEPATADAVAGDTVTINSSSWNSMGVSSWTSSSGGNSGSISVSAGQYLLLRFDNNCLSWTENEDGTFELNTGDRIAFCMTALLIRVASADN